MILLKFVNVRYNFLVNGDWEAESDCILHEEEPQKGDLISYEKIVYEVVAVQKTDNIYDVYLD